MISREAWRNMTDQEKLKYLDEVEGKKQTEKEE